DDVAVRVSLIGVGLLAVERRDAVALGKKEGKDDAAVHGHHLAGGRIYRGVGRAGAIIRVIDLTARVGVDEAVGQLRWDTVAARGPGLRLQRIRRPARRQ